MAVWVSCDCDLKYETASNFSFLGFLSATYLFFLFMREIIISFPFPNKSFSNNIINIILVFYKFLLQFRYSDLYVEFKTFFKLMRDLNQCGINDWL